MSRPGRSWLHHVRRADRPRARLVCFPHAGRGPSMFRPWAAILPDGIELCAASLPGRESRFAEPLAADMDEIVDQLREAVAPVLDEYPTAFYGHSLGALIGFALSRSLTAAGGRGPCHITVSGSRPPHVPDPGPIVADLSDDELIAQLRLLDGTAHEILESPEALQLHLPVLRADFEVSQSYLCPTVKSLSCAITELAGEADPLAAALVGRWAEQTTGDFVSRRLPGNHFFVDTVRPLVVATAVHPLLAHL